MEETGLQADIDLAAATSVMLELQGSAKNITVHVSDGCVTLEGEVKALKESDTVETLVRNFGRAQIPNAVFATPANGRTRLQAHDVTS